MTCSKCHQYVVYFKLSMSHISCFHEQQDRHFHWRVLLIYQVLTQAHRLSSDFLTFFSLIPRPFVGEMAWQIIRVQTVYGDDVTVALVQAMNIG